MGIIRNIMYTNKYQTTLDKSHSFYLLKDDNNGKTPKS